MIDTHCHIDLYPNPSEVALRAEQAGITTIVVTNLPSAFDKAYPHVRPLKHLRLALGMHPLLAREHDRERGRFQVLSEKTSYIGEIGLDFSRAGAATKEIQIQSFRFILEVLRGKPKFITVHSRQAENAIMDILEEFGRSPVVLHWYSGSQTALKRALDNGHYFSVNSGMFSSRKGQQIIAKLPPDRVLTETDGPFIKIGNRPSQPEDVAFLEEQLGTMWQAKRSEVDEKIRDNFLSLIRPLFKR